MKEDHTSLTLSFRIPEQHTICVIAELHYSEPAKTCPAQGRPVFSRMRKTDKFATKLEHRHLTWHSVDAPEQSAAQSAQL